MLPQQNSNCRSTIFQDFSNEDRLFSEFVYWKWNRRTWSQIELCLENSHALKIVCFVRNNRIIIYVFSTALSQLIPNISTISHLNNIFTLELVKQNNLTAQYNYIFHTKPRASSFQKKEPRRFNLIQP